jgi:hypothetical protein
VVTGHLAECSSRALGQQSSPNRSKHWSIAEFIDSNHCQPILSEVQPMSIASTVIAQSNLHVFLIFLFIVTSIGK